ncbi:MAG: glucoamylase family protein [Oscillospiraceae bacterium]|jgi:cyclic beta-1,2-glucan synthetase
MSDYNKIINAALGCSVREKPFSALFRDIKHIHAELKRQYRDIVFSAPKNSSQQIIFENFYMIEKFCRLLLRENRKTRLSVNASGCPLTGIVLFSACKEDELVSTDEAVKLINMLSQKKYISNTELENLVWSFRFTLIKKLFEQYGLKKENDITVLEIITLLTKSDTFDLKKITAECNPLERIYTPEKSGVYSQMDEQTRRLYRNRTSAVSIKRGIPEYETAEKFLKAANTAFIENKPEKQTHIGFYIFNEYNRLHKKISAKAYVFMTIILTAILTAAASFYLKNAYLWLLIFFPLWEISKVIIDRIFTNGCEISYLPRMDLKNRIPNDAKTIIVISTLIDTQKDIKMLKSKLIRLLFSNNTENLKICALCDLKQSEFPELSEDEALVRNSKRLINKLNEVYSDKFIMIIRKRSFSKTQQKYTGFERKRGAIEQLVRFIKNEPIRFLFAVGDLNFLHSARYIAALDYDTKALIDTVPELVGIACHPLNKPEISGGKVISGYGIITPRITTKLKSSLKSPFSKLVGGIGSSCAYDTLCSDIYQDTFNESIFSGKGLIDTDIYYKLCCSFFPQERILSHDILEGGLMRTGFAGDVEFSDGFPATAISYYKRLHRWIRGDFQNAFYLSGKIPVGEKKISTPFSFLDRFKLFDNLRRAFIPINIILLFLISYLYDKSIVFFLSLIGIISVIIPYLGAFICSIMNNGLYSLSRKYYSGVISQTTEIISQGFFSLLLLPVHAVISADAIFRSLWRTLISKKNLLQWTTAHQTEKNSSGYIAKIRFYFFPELISVFLLLSPCPAVKLLALFYVLVPFIISYADTPYLEKIPKKAAEKCEGLITDLSSMWQFYEDYATEKENWLPPDNVQFAPVFRVCRRTSPTNIGLMLLSALSARDFDIIDTAALYKRLDRTLHSVERLEKHNGNLYNWYETKTLKLSNNPFVSAVDSGNFVCCLVTLKEGLKEYCTEHEEISSLIRRINTLIDNTDIGYFYDEAKGLLSIGFSPEKQAFSNNHYDMLMSEARMTSYFAVAKRQVPKKHWRNLGRTIARSGLYAGPVSYSGTMFEFFMPELLLESEKGSLSYEGLEFCLFCQKKRAKLADVPFGISESGYYAFDNALNYQYKAHGVQKIGLKRGLDNELVVSPYSSYLVLEHDFDSAFANLNELKEYGMYGSYGFYEAIDFSEARTQNNGAIIKSYMAHHVGMSIVAITNAVRGGCMKKRFFRDNHMKSADELLQEKVMPGAVMFEDIIKRQPVRKPADDEAETEYYDRLFPSQPNVRLLCNGEYTLALTDLGASIALYQGNDVYSRTTDILRRPQGCYFAVCENGRHSSFTWLPEYASSEEMSVEFESNTVSYYRNTDELQTGMKVHLHSNLPCELRQFAFKNTSTRARKISLLSYIEPVLSSYNDHNAHPAFSRLFLNESYDIDTKCIMISRKNRHSDERLFCAIGFIEDVELFSCLSREEVLSRPDGVSKVFFNNEQLIQNYSSIPDPCVFLKTELTLEPGEHKERTLFILTSLKKNELLRSIAKLRLDKQIQTMSASVIPAASLEGRIVNSILPQILFKKRDCTKIQSSIESNRLAVSELWRLGISGDVPIILAELTNINDTERIQGYSKAHSILRLCGIKTDLVFLFDDKGEYSREYFTLISGILAKLKLSESISAPGGIFLIDSAGLDKPLTNLLSAIAVHLAPLSMVRIGTPSQEFKPLKILPVKKIFINPEISLQKGGFDKNRFVINEKTEMPWCHILANPAFGTLISESALGFTYAVNSRENKLTPWFNDSRSDNRGEMLLLKISEKCYDMVLGSTAVFTPEKAQYFAKADEFISCVSVSVSKNGMCKKIELELEWKASSQNAEIAFYTEPVLGVNRDNSRMLVFSSEGGALIANNPLNNTVSGYMAITAEEKTFVHITNREQFLRGDWLDKSLSSSNEPCASVVVPTRCSPNAKQRLVFYMSFAKEKNAALKMPKLFTEFMRENKNSINIQTPDKLLNSIFNHWLDWQTLGGRIYARTGFYQNSGAWGFRDQLQDSCASLLINPSITKRQLARACTAQFVEGDVLHWWHKLPNNVMRGVRTHYSDDLIWLPYTLCEYLEKTADLSILGISISYCEGITLNDDQHELYGEVKRSSVSESIYNHCKKALEHAYRAGERGLILMGCGDWNDSFNGVGIQGKGESVWLSQFMIIVLRRFSKIAEKIGDIKTKEDFLTKSHSLAFAVEESCWDGEWYLRAFFDNGDELGSKNSPACQIDSLAQSFAVLSELSSSERNIIALSSAYSKLCDRKNGIVKLFASPFENNEMPVGYAASYPAGIRENGGQYTHGAIWLAIAHFKAGLYDKGYQLLKLLNPAEKFTNEASANMFKNEPYYFSADIYTNTHCYGRGGWSIYTGAAAWYYRAVFEWLLGVKIRYNAIFLSPYMPSEWNEFEITLNYSETKIHITAVRGDSFGIFDNDRRCDFIPIDGKEHEIRAVIPKDEK